MADGLITPELVLQVAEAAKDYRITSAEFAGIMGSVTSIFAGMAIAGLTGMLLGVLGKRFTMETGIKLREEMGIPIPV